MSVNRTYRFVSNKTGAPAAGAVADLLAGAPSQGYFGTNLMSGPTASRPQATDADFGARGVQAGIFYLDTTLGYVVVSNGAGGWVNPYSGAVV